MSAHTSSSTLEVQIRKSVFCRALTLAALLGAASCSDPDDPVSNPTNTEVRTRGDRSDVPAIDAVDEPVDDPTLDIPDTDEDDEPDAPEDTNQTPSRTPNPASRLAAPATKPQTARAETASTAALHPA